MYRYRDHGCKGCSPYVGGALHFRERGIRSCIFFRMFAGMQFLSEQKNIQRPEGKEDYTRTPGRTFFQLQEQGANNINLVTAGHFLPQVAVALEMSKEQGLHIPVVYNSSGYEKAKTLKMLDGLVDIYLPDFKYMDAVLAKKYSHAQDYPEIAKEALSEMGRQVGEAEFDSRGMMKKGVIVRQLLLPGHVKDAKNVLKYLYETYGDRIYISMMNQYTPMPVMKDDPQLSRKVTDREYERLIDYAISLGLKNGFMQEGETAKESFIPEFDGEGV